MIRVFLVLFASIAGGMASVEGRVGPDTLGGAAFVAAVCCLILRRDKR